MESGPVCVALGGCELSGVSDALRDSGIEGTSDDVACADAETVAEAVARAGLADAEDEARWDALACKLADEVVVLRSDNADEGDLLGLRVALAVVLAHAVERDERDADVDARGERDVDADAEGERDGAGVCEGSDECDADPLALALRSAEKDADALRVRCADREGLDDADGERDADAQAVEDALEWALRELDGELVAVALGRGVREGVCGLVAD